MAKRRRVVIPKVIIKDQEKPLQVEMDKSEAMPVVIAKEEPGQAHIVNKGEGKTLAPQTTEQQDLTTAGQREINVLWEKTQARIALSVVFFTVFVNGALTLTLIITKGDLTGSQAIGVSFLNMICGIVISFYFSRTNHAAIGGVGSKPTDTQEYKGR